MAALDSDSEEDLVSYGTGLEPLEEGEGSMAGTVCGAQAGSPAREPSNSSAWAWACSLCAQEPGGEVCAPHSRAVFSGPDEDAEGWEVQE